MKRAGGGREGNGHDRTGIEGGGRRQCLGEKGDRAAMRDG